MVKFWNEKIDKAYFLKVDKFIFYIAFAAIILNGLAGAITYKPVIINDYIVLMFISAYIAVVYAFLSFYMRNK